MIRVNGIFTLVPENSQLVPSSDQEDSDGPFDQSPFLEVEELKSDGENSQQLQLQINSNSNNQVEDSEQQIREI